LIVGLEQEELLGQVERIAFCLRTLGGPPALNLVHAFCAALAFIGGERVRRSAALRIVFALCVGQTSPPGGAAAS
jgi:hypothetical protein